MLMSELTTRSKEVSKYQALAEHPKATNAATTQLEFSEIGRILGGGLPPFAYEHLAWWANSRADGSHAWAHLWIDAGWLVSQVDLARKAVTFTCFTHLLVNIAPDLADLVPRKRAFVMDLLENAGIDVSAWGFTTDNVAVKEPKANPSYCYD